VFSLMPSTGRENEAAGGCMVRLVDESQHVGKCGHDPCFVHVAPPSAPK